MSRSRCTIEGCNTLKPVKPDRLTQIKLIADLTRNTGLWGSLWRFKRLNFLKKPYGLAFVANSPHEGGEWAFDAVQKRD
jgi:hypothetical protein